MTISIIQVLKWILFCFRVTPNKSLRPLFFLLQQFSRKRHLNFKAIQWWHQKTITSSIRKVVIHFYSKILLFSAIQVTLSQFPSFWQKVGNVEKMIVRAHSSGYTNTFSTHPSQSHSEVLLVFCTHAFFTYITIFEPKHQSLPVLSLSEIWLSPEILIEV